MLKYNTTSTVILVILTSVNIQILVILTSVNIQILVILTFLDSQILVILTFLESSILVIDVFSQPNSGHVDVSRQPTITRISASEADLKLKKSSAEFFTPFALLRGSISYIYINFFPDHGRVPLIIYLSAAFFDSAILAPHTKTHKFLGAWVHFGWSECPFQMVV